MHAASPISPTPTPLRTPWQGLVWATCLLVMTACGGGGGGGSSTGSGSPVPVSNDLGAQLSVTTLSVERDLADRSYLQQPTVSLKVTAAPDGYYYRITYTKTGIDSVTHNDRSVDAGQDLHIAFTPALAQQAGTYNDTITIEVCLDQACAQPAKGSPFVVPVKLSVGYYALSDPALPPLQVASSTTLPHDVVDAAYSASLDAVVSVSTRPAATINVHDLKTGLTRSQSLPKMPTSLSLEPGGLRAAVGHDALLSVVNLALPGAPGAMTVTTQLVSIPVGSVVFDARQRVHAFANFSSQWRPMYSWDMATGDVTQTVGSSPFSPGLYGRAMASLHPSTTRLYAIENDLNPNDIYASDLTGTTPGPLQDSPYHGDYNLCGGGLWFSTTGDRIYTPCGPSFTSSADPSQDMRYAGTLLLRPSDPNSTLLLGSPNIVALDQHPVTGELALLEQFNRVCGPRTDNPAQCFTSFSLYNSSSLALIRRQALAPITVAGNRLAQIGRKVLHRSNGQTLIVSDLRNAPDPTAAAVLSILP